MTRQKLLNIILIAIAIFGPVLFSMRYFIYFQISVIFSVFCFIGAGPLGAIAVLTFLIVNIKHFKKPIALLTLPLLAVLLCANVYSFHPVYRYFEIFYNFKLDIFNWIYYTLHPELSNIFPLHGI